MTWLRIASHWRVPGRYVRSLQSLEVDQQHGGCHGSGQEDMREELKATRLQLLYTPSSPPPARPRRAGTAPAPDKHSRTKLLGLGKCGHGPVLDPARLRNARPLLAVRLILRP